MPESDSITNQKEHANIFNLAVKGGFWVFAIRITAQVLSLCRYMLLMNVLQVKDMGLLGIAFLMIQILNTFSTTGFNLALIQKTTDSESFLDTAWTVNIIRACVLFTILYFASPVFVGFKNLPAEEASLTISVIRVLGLSFFIGAFSNIGIIYFKKDLQFHKEFVLQIMPTLISIVVSVVLVLFYKSVWSLILGRLSANIFRCIVSYFMHPYRPKLNLDLQKAKQLWGFGKWVFAATIIGFLLTQGDDLFVWFYIDAFALGLYQAAYKFSNLPATEITHVISQVSFPAYSKLQTDIPRLRASYLKILKLTACLSVPAAGLIFILTPEFVEIFLKDEWQPIGLAIRIMVIAGMLRSFGATTGPLFLAMGRPDITPKAASVSLVFLAAIILPLTERFGFEGTALAVLATTIFVQPMCQFFVIRLIKIKFRDMIQILIAPLFSVLTVMAVLYMVKKYYDFEAQQFDLGSIIYFAVMSISGLGAYLAILLVIDRIFNSGIMNMFKEQLKVLSR